MSEHLFHLSDLKPQDVTEGGQRTKANNKNFPILQGMSLYKLLLQPQGVREPHWHPNAIEMAYCLKGQVLVTMYNTGDARTTFLVEAGEVFWIPSGALHDIENVGQSAAELLVSFSHEQPEDFDLSSTLGAFSDAVLGNTWGVKSSVFHPLKRSTKGVFAAKRKGPAVIPEEARYVSAYRFRLEASRPLLTNDGGSARMARRNVWPIAESRALFSLRLTGEGMREPHWHPETAEMGYVNKGKGRMSILHPSGKLETYTMKAGDLYFIPKAYPHHIENLEEGELHVLVFFDQGMPTDIGLTAGVRAYSNEVLGATMGCDGAFFEKLPKYYADLFIVNKTNPLD